MILNSEELKKLRKKCEKEGNNNYLTYTDSYEVKFTIKVGQFWHQDVVVYFADNKGYERKVEARWRKDYQGKQTRLISVKYQ